MSDRDPGPAGAGPYSDARSLQKPAWRGVRSVPLKLLRALRGKGALHWPGGEIRVTYELDIFARGATHTVSGRVQGDLSALAGRDAGARPGGASLRLRDGREIEIEFASLGRGAAEFDARHPSDAAALLAAGADAPT
ncbi:MAG TPA: hypothetical protein VKT30_17150 [Caulobacteraceae bacterium]|nr:hypothetical protein [Caulobacteraceae bacterium]